MMSEAKPRCVVFGATGRTGRLLVERFVHAGWHVVAVGRNVQKLKGLGSSQALCDFDAPDFDMIESPVQSGDVVVLSAGARFTPQVVQLCPLDIKRLVVLGSARYLSAYPGDVGIAVNRAIDLLKSQPFDWTLLAPTMIYGAQGENNVQRMAALIRKFRFVPLPGGGQNLLQPIHVLDVVEATLLAAEKPEAGRKVIHIAGPEPVSNKAFLEAIAHTIGVPVSVQALPKWLMTFLAAVTRVVPGIPTITQAEVERLLEDRTVETGDMQAILGLEPRSLDEGLREAFGPNT